MARFWLMTWTLIVIFSFSGCDSRPSRTPYDDEPAGERPKDPVDDVKAAFASQYKFLKVGEAEKLKEFFTKRQKGRLTQAVVDQGRVAVGALTLDDLLGSVRLGVLQGQKTAKITMKNGRTLTTLVLIDGEWLSDAVWFR